MSADEVRTGQDTATGTDPAAKYDGPGYEDKSFGQAVNQDMDAVDALVAETHGDLAAAEDRFEHESAGAPVLARQSADEATAGATTPAETPTEHPTGEEQAEENRANDPPA